MRPACLAYLIPTISAPAAVAHLVLATVVLWSIRPQRRSGG
ncbi:hypothetical protein [Mobilicoccus caccae]|nr:hypothetical protein [Mobilicoccus caccae]